MKMQGYNGSQSWDTSFAMQAISEAGLAARFPELTKGHVGLGMDTIYQ